MNQNLTNSQSAPYLVNVFNTEDAYEQATSLGEWFVDYEQLSAGKFKGWMMDARLQDIQIFREIYNQSVYQNGTCKEGTVAFGLPFRSEGNSGFWGHRIKSRDFLCFKGGEELDYRSSEDVDMVGIVVMEDEFLELADTLGYSNIAPALEAKVLRAPEACEPLSIMLNSMSQIMSTTPEILRHASVQKTIKESILATILYFLNSVEKEDMNFTNPSYISHRKVVEKAKAYMTANFDRPVSMVELCRATAVSQRTLQYCFESVFNTNPVNYLKLMRLNGVRRSLKTNRSGNASVQTAAEEWGFWHLSRMAKEYKELFGELPSETLKTNPYIKYEPVATLLPS